MDQLDKQILDVLQMDFPLAPRPYAVIAERLNLTEEAVWQRVQDLMSQGIIRRLGASLDSRKLGYQSTLVGIRVPAPVFEQAVQMLDAYPEVTHCYQRQNEYNIWFTLIAPSQERIAEILAEIQQALALTEQDILNAPVERLFKLDARFRASRPEDTSI
ncbi:Lrp/AsnC family transcriptional regulator [Planctomycetota bacterium]